MSKILNSFERLALAALAQTASVPAHGDSSRGFGKVHLDNLSRMGLAAPTPSRTDMRNPAYAISENGWLCMFGLTKAQIDGAPSGQKPVAFRVWQWPQPQLKAAC
jgi:hypothetical protein